MVTPAWMGLLSTLISLPVLLTADAVARVFEPRTGGLVRPIPWSISGPLALGTLLSATGVVLAITGWPASPAIAFQGVLFRQHWYLIPAAVAFLAAAYGVPEFAQRVCDWNPGICSPLVGSMSKRWTDRSPKDRPASASV